MYIYTMDFNQIKAIWVACTKQFSAPENMIMDAFDHLVAQYSTKKRHYHNLHHISALLALQQQHATLITDNDTMLFSIFFHDVVYNVLRNDNEVESAATAASFLSAIRFPPDRIQKVVQFIEATKTHANNTRYTDLDYLLDFDLSILGAPAVSYQLYQQQIRREYAVFPDAVYYPGRKKVLQHFLNKQPVFKTSSFQELYEKQAIENITAELESLPV